MITHLEPQPGDLFHSYFLLHSPPLNHNLNKVGENGHLIDIWYDGLKMWMFNITIVGTVSIFPNFVNFSIEPASLPGVGGVMVGTVRGFNN